MNCSIISSAPPSSFPNKIKPNLKLYDKESVQVKLICRRIPLKLVKDIFELIEETPQELIGENWQKYVIFKDSKVATSMRYDSDQERYGNWMHHSLRMAVKGLKEKNWSFDELLHFLCFARHYISPNSNYGDSRDKKIDTFFHVTCPYIAVYNFYKFYVPDGVTCKVKNLSGGGKKFIHIGKIEDEKIKLSKIFTLESPCKFLDTTLGGILSHTRVEKIDKIMTFVETKLYPEALQEDNKDELIKKLGKIFWWICQAKPWMLGDPSIAEMLIRTIWASKGFEQPAWKEGIIPWIEVTNEPDVERFAEDFHKLFK